MLCAALDNKSAAFAALPVQSLGFLKKTFLRSHTLLCMPLLCLRLSLCFFVSNQLLNDGIGSNASIPVPMEFMFHKPRAME